MNFTPTSAISYLQKYPLEENDGLRVVITKGQHEEIHEAMRRARRPTKWVELDLQDESLKPLFAEMGRADVRINLREEFPEFPEEAGATSTWYISIFSKFLGVTDCFPRPTQELFDLYCKKEPRLKWRKIDQDASEAPACDLAPPQRGQAIASPLHGPGINGSEGVLDAKGAK